MLEKVPPPIEVKNIKAADPGVSLLLINPEGDSLEQLSITVNLTQRSLPLNEFQTQISLSNPTSAEELNILVPFGDDAYQSGETLHVTILISFLWEGSITTIPVRGLVLTTAGQMTVGSNLVKVLKQGRHLAALPSFQILTSMDDRYIGVLGNNGRLLVYPVSIIGDHVNTLPAVYDSLLENNNAEHCALVFGSDGYVKIEFSPTTYFISQPMPRGTTGLAIVGDDCSPVPAAALCFVDDAGTALEVVSFT